MHIGIVYVLKSDEKAFNLVNPIIWKVFEGIESVNSALLLWLETLRTLENTE